MENSILFFEPFPYMEFSIFFFIFLTLPEYGTLTVFFLDQIYWIKICLAKYLAPDLRVFGWESWLQLEVLQELLDPSLFPRFIKNLEPTGHMAFVAWVWFWQWWPLLSPTREWSPWKPESKTIMMLIMKRKKTLDYNCHYLLFWV